jgi:hypothetical protein
MLSDLMEYGTSDRIQAHQRTARHHGLPRCDPRQPAPGPAGNERPAATWKTPSAAVNATMADRPGPNWAWTIWTNCSCAVVDEPASSSDLMGPTAGKTDLAIELTKVLPCELISVDSALVYRAWTSAPPSLRKNFWRNIPTV